MKILAKIIKNPLFWIFTLALFIRIYKLGEFPYGFHIDEAKVAWNALSILKTGADDHLNLYSLYYNSFGDYRPTGILYFTIPSIILFGRTIFAARFSVAFFGALTIFPIYLLANIIDKKSTKFNSGYLSSILFAFSPWSIDLSRATNEVVISSFFALFSLYFFINLIKRNKKSYAIYFTVSILLSYFLYHSIRFLAPLVLVITFLHFFKIIKKNKNTYIVGACVIFTLLITLILSTTKEGLARFSQVSIFKDVDTIYQIERLSQEKSSNKILSYIFDNKIIIYTKAFIESYIQYFSGNFLVGTSGKPYRFSTPGVGLLLYTDLIFVLFGLIQIIRGKKSTLPILLLLIAPLPAAITAEDAPNLSRAFLMLPFLILVAGSGWEWFTKLKLSNKGKLFSISLIIINFSYFSYMYFFHSVNHRPFLKNYSGDSPTYRNVGISELSNSLDILKYKYEKIVITNFPDSPYPWYAYFSNKNPSEFNRTYSNKTNERVYENIIFSEDKCPSESALLKYNKKNILIVDSWECPFNSLITDGYPLKIVGTINRPDGSMVYTLLERDWKKPLVIKGVYY